MKINKFKTILTSIMLSLMVLGCTEILEPPYVGYIEDEDIWSNSKYAHGVLNMVYENINDETDYFYGIELDYYTDNAVENTGLTQYATGGANASYYPLGIWDFHYLNIIQINKYLKYGVDMPFDHTDTIEGEPVIEKVYRFGEAHFLRAWSESELLKQYAGPIDAAGSEIMGVPLFRDDYNTAEIPDIARSSYNECVDSILSDLEVAIENCPFAYDEDSGDNAIQYKGRATQRAALALKSRVLLHAASPAFNLTGNQDKWNEAALAAYDAIMMDGGLSDLGSLDDENDDEHIDVIWKTRTFRRSNVIENDHFPPSYYGRGRCNPSQNLVDAFPMNNGTPIDEEGSGYDPLNPYDNRDNRFINFIVHNNDSLYNYKVVKTYLGGPDAIGGLRDDATRTGYYMQRFTSDVATDNDPRRFDGKSTGDMTFVRLLDRQEVYLNFAEAANEVTANPTDVVPGTTISAFDVLVKIRSRGGSSALEYIENLQGNGQLTQSKFREIIKNERRIELCFRGFRYWDIRRWMEPMDYLNQPLEGIVIDRSVGAVESFSYSTQKVEDRMYQSNTYYGPLPYDEVAKSNALIQNYGW